MRPPEFTGGNFFQRTLDLQPFVGFNEAAGIHRRKQARAVLKEWDSCRASMRPPEFTGGNRLPRKRHLPSVPPLQ